MLSELYVIVKMVSGEQCFAILDNEDTNFVTLVNPMLIKTTIDFSIGKEHVTAVPLCQFSEDKSYLIEKRNILFIKKLHETFIPHYNRIVAEHNQTVLVTQGADGVVKKAEDLRWDESENINELSSEELQKRLEILNSLLSGEEEKESEVGMNLIKGNDTVH